MPSQSKILECLPCGYGYVVLTATGSVFVNMWLAHNVVNARKKFNVEYPKLYAEDEKKEFNCIQRAHQHTLEIYPQFLALLLLGGLQNPVVSAGAGAVYLVGRIVAAKGYYTGDPSKRKYGAFGMIGLLVLLGNTLCFAFHQLNWHPLRSLKSS
jgi:glutathione S-transferase